MSRGSLWDRGKQRLYVEYFLIHWRAKLYTVGRLANWLALSERSYWRNRSWKMMTSSPPNDLRRVWEHLRRGKRGKRCSLAVWKDPTSARGNDTTRIQRCRWNWAQSKEKTRKSYSEIWFIRWAQRCVLDSSPGIDLGGCFGIRERPFEADGLGFPLADTSEKHLE